MKKNENDREVIQWGREYLLSNGYTLRSDSPENVQNTPWSYVVRFVTSKGYIYLKHTPHLLALEANILRMLHDHSCPVAEVIAHNAKLDCFLMKDAGRPLREILKKQFVDQCFIDLSPSFRLRLSNHGVDYCKGVLVIGDCFIQHDIFPFHSSRRHYTGLQG